MQYIQYFWFKADVAFQNPICFCFVPQAFDGHTQKTKKTKNEILYKQNDTKAPILSDFLWIFEMSFSSHSGV